MSDSPLHATREALKNPYPSGSQNLHSLALAEVAAAEAVIEAARRVRSPDGDCTCRYMGDGDVHECVLCIQRERHRALDAALRALDATEGTT